MPAQLLVGDERGRHLTDVSDPAGPPWTSRRVGRGLALGYLDNDGRVHLLLVASGRSAGLLPQPDPRRPCPDPSPGGDGLRARRRPRPRVRSSPGGRRRVRLAITAGGATESASDPRLHFGLGAADRARGHRSGLALGAGRSLRSSRGRCRVPGCAREKPSNEAPGRLPTVIRGRRRSEDCGRGLVAPASNARATKSGLQPTSQPTCFRLARGVHQLSSTRLDSMAFEGLEHRL